MVKIYSKDEKNHAIALISKGKTVESVSKLYNVTPRTIRDWLQNSRKPLNNRNLLEVIRLIESGFQKREIIQKLQILPKDVEKVLSKLIVFRYLQGWSVKVIEMRYKSHHKKISKILDWNGIVRIEQANFFTLISRIKESRNIHLNSGSLIQFVWGNLLGDANIQCQTKTDFLTVKKFFVKEFDLHTYSNGISFINERRRLRFDINEDFTKVIQDFNFYSSLIVQSASSHLRMGKSILELPFLENCLSKIYEKNGYKINLSIKMKRHYNGTTYTGTYKLQVAFQTINSIQLTQAYFDWYPEQVKIIPSKNFNLTANTLFVWYLDDGSYSKTPRKENSKSFRHFLNFSTECFTKDENLFLVQEIFRLTKIKFSVIKSKNGAWRLSLTSQSSIENFLNFICLNSDKELVEEGKKWFPWKFNISKNKTWYLNRIRIKNDPLVELFDMRIKESERGSFIIRESINKLLEMTGSKLRVDIKI